LSPPILVLLLLWAAESFALLIYWTLQATGSQGRLLFPGMIAFGILLAVGLDFWLRWLPSLVRRIAWATLFVGLLGMSAYAWSCCCRPATMPRRPSLPSLRLPSRSI